jgi:hypothetical protein
LASALAWFVLISSRLVPISARRLDSICSGFLLYGCIAIQVQCSFQSDHFWH